MGDKFHNHQNMIREHATRRQCQRRALCVFAYTCVSLSCVCLVLWIYIMSITSECSSACNWSTSNVMKPVMIFIIVMKTRLSLFGG